jgi:hypothetical protein
MTEFFFGRKVPSVEKQAQNNQYLIRQLGFTVPEPGTVDVKFTYPNYIKEYDQGNIGACTGYAGSWMSSMYNGLLYNAYWLYKEGQRTDNDPNTSGDNDGGYVWAIMDVLRKQGHRKIVNGITQAVDINEGIQSYYWAKTINDLRTAASLNRIGVFGILWYEDFMNPRTIGGEFWIGARPKSKWGRVLGGHAIAYSAVSDNKMCTPLNKKGAVALRNSWGTGWASGKDVWVPYESIQELLYMQGELAIALDYVPDPTPPPPPPPPPQETMNVTLITDANKKYSGTLKKV